MKTVVEVAMKFESMVVRVFFPMDFPISLKRSNSFHLRDDRPGKVCHTTQRLVHTPEMQVCILVPYVFICD